MKSISWIFLTVYPNVKETLKTLKEYKKAVISNKRESLSKKSFGKTGSAAVF